MLDVSDLIDEEENTQYVKSLTNRSLHFIDKYEMRKSCYKMTAAQIQEDDQDIWDVDYQTSSDEEDSSSSDDEPSAEKNKSEKVNQILKLISKDENLQKRNTEAKEVQKSLR